jgi:hypothetical protein
MFVFRSIKFTLKWSLEIAGLSIIGFNALPEEKRNSLIGIYKSGRNAYRFYEFSKDIK